MSVLIRRATAADVPAITALTETVWRHAYPGIISHDQIDYMLERLNDPQTLTRQITKKERIVLLALRNDLNAGFASTGLSQNDKTIYRIHQLYILPQAQKNGIGQRLIAAAETEAKKVKCALLELNVNRNNPAYHFYVRLGFSTVREVDIPYGPYVLNDYVMQRKMM